MENPTAGDWSLVFRQKFTARLGNIPHNAWGEWVKSVRNMDKSLLDQVIEKLAEKFLDKNIDPGDRRVPKLGDFERVYRMVSSGGGLVEFKNCSWCNNNGHTHVVYGGFNIEVK